MNTSLLRSFQELKGRPPNDAETAKFLRVQKVLNLGDNDALWLVLFALDDVKPVAPKGSFFPIAASACLSIAVGLIAGFFLSQKIAPPIEFSEVQKGQLRAIAREVLSEVDDSGKKITIRLADRVLDGRLHGDLPIGQGTIEQTDAPPRTEPPKIEN